MFQEDGNAIAQRIGQTGAARDQLLRFAVIFKGAFGHGADQQFKQFGVHGGMIVARLAAMPAQARRFMGSRRSSSAVKKAGSGVSSSGTAQT